MQLKTQAELAAKQAEVLPAFSGLNLLHIRRELSHLLSLIGRDGIFDEYTRHDISHIDKMLSGLEWLIPQSTRQLMTPTDWLLIVLAIYFHDLGMLVTRKEYENRNASGFKAFVESTLFAGDAGADYRETVSSMSEEKRERYLYQEFVRHNHALRIRNWINGQDREALGVTEEIAAEVNGLLAPLGRQFARDLSFVCESHHLDDLGDLHKYRVAQPYGNSNEETGNLQFAAVVLRAADLLHITSDRTPSVLFRTINPADPISQEEWSKQMAVTRIRPKLGLNEDGEPDPSAAKDTIEVHAYFTKEDGFFGLTAYLAYATEQLARCHDWVMQTNRKKLALHAFPWMRIDDSNIETEGFIRDAFQFTIDQAKILDLLTGHTLYNDSSVVLRELVQNSLDAIKLRLYEEPQSESGLVAISWDSANRILSVQDNGTGMTQEVIRNHLLKVGASLYQDADFKKRHPDFTSISRFGIGVLSTFMIADSVEIVTSHSTEEQARRLSLRSVHGKYLVSLLDKETNPLASSLAKSGTVFRLRVRHSVKMPDVVRTARQWFVVPGCAVTVSIDDGDPIPIGYANVRGALVAYLQSIGRRVVDDVAAAPQDETGDPPTAVVLHESDGNALACGLQWSRYFHEWSFLPVQSTTDRIDAAPPPIGTCVEGIRINSETPGFSGRSIVALSNTSGPHAPKTNVARSGLEKTPELEAMLEGIYSGYCAHARQELTNLSSIRGHSLTWAIQEAQFLLAPLWYGGRRLSKDSEPLNRDILTKCLQGIPFLLIEDSDGRRAVSAQYVQSQERFWTIECPLLRSAERLIRESATNASLRTILEALDVSLELPTEPLLCLSTIEYTDWSEAFAFKEREVSEFRFTESERRLDVSWSRKSEPPRWLSLPDKWKSRYYTTAQSLRYHEPIVRSNDMWLCRGSVEISGLGDHTSIRYRDITFLLPGSPLHSFLLPILDKELALGRYDERVPSIVLCMGFVEYLLSRPEEVLDVEQELRRFMAKAEGGGRFDSTPLSDADRDQLSDAAFLTAIADSHLKIFDPNAWERRRGEWF